MEMIFPSAGGSKAKALGIAIVTLVASAFPSERGGQLGASTTVVPRDRQATKTHANTADAAAANARVSESYSKLPLYFEANQGQTDEQVRFLARGSGYGLYLTAREAVLVLARPNPDGSLDRRAARAPAPATAVLRMALVGANRMPLVTGREELPGEANYFVGKDPAQWRTNVPTFAKVHYREVYPGIDLVYYGNQRQLEYDFVVAPGANPKKIVLGFKGADKLEIDSQGDLVLHTTNGDLRQRKPVIYQEVDGVRREIAGGYVRKGANRVGFKLAAYDTSRPLVIDPVVLAYSTYLGGGGHDGGSGIAVDADGNAYITGASVSLNFPATAGALQTFFAGGFSDAFVTKLDPTGSILVYSTYLGGSSTDSGYGIAVDADGNAYVTGRTVPDFPTTAGALQTSTGGGFDAFVTKLDPTGSALVYSTFLGGSGMEQGFGIAVDTAGNAYVTGNTESTNFPTTLGAFQTAIPCSVNWCISAFVTKLDATGSALFYSTYLGGMFSDSGFGITVDAAGNAYVTGKAGSPNFPTTTGAFQTTGSSNAFVSKLDPTGAALVYSTFLGGTFSDQGQGIGVDADGNAYVTGYTESANFPTTANAFQSVFGGFHDAFVAKLNSSGAALIYSTYVGGSGLDLATGIAVDAVGNAYVTGWTDSINFPNSPVDFHPIFGGGTDVFVVKVDPTGSALVYSTYLGGSGLDHGSGIAVDTAGNAHITGGTDSTNFPTTLQAFQPAFGGGGSDGFVAKIVLVVLPPLGK